MKSSTAILMLLLGGGVLLGSRAQGQTVGSFDAAKLKIVDQPLPPGPVLERASTPSAWTITYSYPDAVTPKNGEGVQVAPSIPRIVQLQVTKASNFWHEVQTYSNGAERSTWHVGNLQLNPSSAPGKYAIYDPSSFGRDVNSPAYDPMLYSDYSQSDFPDAKWISRANYAGSSTLDDTPCLVFKKNDKSAKQSLTALIDPSTHLPILLQNDSTTLHYQFGSAPLEAQALPPDIVALLTQRAAVMKMLTTRVPSY